MAKNVVIVLMDKANLLTLTSMLETFSSVNWRRSGGKDRAYNLFICSAKGGAVETWNGFTINSISLQKLDDVPIDTLIISGGWGFDTAVKNRKLIKWVRERSVQARRVCALGGGLFLAAEAGLLNGQRVAIHPIVYEPFQRRFPGLEADRHPLFITNGRIWTSPGMTAATDMTLALIEEDLGKSVALDIARFLLLFTKRSGTEQQVSAVLSSQSQSDRFEELHSWVAAHLGERINVEVMARRVGMSVRNFSRAYVAAMGQTPSRVLRSIRVESAVRALTSTSERISQIAYDYGFGNEERMRRTFVATYGVPPSRFRSPKGSNWQKNKPRTLQAFSLDAQKD